MTIVAGVDEVGRGPLAGPVVAAAVVLREPVAGLADSKLLSRATREALAVQLRSSALIGTGAVSAAGIDALGIHKACLLAMRRAVLVLCRRHRLHLAHVLIDGRFCPDLAELAPAPELRAVIGGDRSEPVIGAASIVAKVLRDALMRRLDLRHPGYGFAAHVGYPTKQHREALGRLGPCRHHRRSFAPVRGMLAQTGSGGDATSPAAHGSSSSTCIK